jgi:hypothetical protein
MLEGLWCLVAKAATAVDTEVTRRAARQLQPAAAELAGVQSGLPSFGPTERYLKELSSTSPR